MTKKCREHALGKFVETPLFDDILDEVKEQEERNWLVYLLLFKNGKKYYGITSQKLNRRWRNGNGYKKKYIITYAIEKYGWDNIEKKVLFTGLTQEEASKIEIELITKDKTTDRKYGYNLAPGGTGGAISPKVIYQYDLTGKFIKKWKSANLISKYLDIDPSTIHKCCLNRYQCLTIQGNIFLHDYYKQLPEDILKHRLSKSYRKTVYQYDKKGNYIAKYKSVSEAAKVLKITVGQISSCCTNHVKTANNFIFLNVYYEKLPDDILKSRICHKHVKSKKVYQYSKEGLFLAEWSSVTEAANAISCKSPGNIANSCIGKDKTVYGFIWLYKKYDYLPNSILKNRLIHEGAISKSKKVIEITQPNKVFSSLTEAANFYGRTVTEVSKVCKNVMSHVKGNRFVYLKDYLEKSEYYDNLAKEKVIIKPNPKKIVEIESGKIFNTATEASKFFNVSWSSIGKVCRGIISQIKGHRFAYLHDYENNLEYYKKLAKEKIIRRPPTQKIIELESLKVFNSMREASKFFNINKNKISKSCKNKITIAKIFKFMFYEDYLKMQESVTQMKNLNTTEINSKYQESVKALDEIDFILKDLKTLIAKEELLADNLITV